VILCAAALHAHAGAAQAGAQTGRTQTVTLAEGPSFVVPAEWDVHAAASTPPGRPAETVELTVRTRDYSVSFQFDHFETLKLRRTDLASLKVSLQKGLSPGSLADLDSPTSHGFFQRRPALVGHGTDEYFFWVEVGGKPWYFKCSEVLQATRTQRAGAGGCLTVMRGFNAHVNETPAASAAGSAQGPQSPGAIPRASTPLASGSDSASTSGGSGVTPSQRSGVSTATVTPPSPPQMPRAASSQSASPPMPPPAGVASTTFTTIAGFAVDLLAGWRVGPPEAARSEDGRQSFRSGGSGAFVISTIRQMEKNPRYQSVAHPQGSYPLSHGWASRGEAVPVV